MAVIAAILVCLSIQATKAVELSCQSSITCPCGEKGEHVTICVPPAAVYSEVCTRLSKCESCEKGSNVCSECPEGLEGPFCNQEKTNTEKSILNMRYCQDPGVDKNGFRQPSSPSSRRGFPMGTRLEYSCNQRYDLNGEERIFCLTSSEWSAIRPSCVSKFQTPEKPDTDESITVLRFCRDPGIVKNGIRQASSSTRDREFPMGTLLEYSCEEGYDLKGEKHLYCLTSGEWTARRPRCVAQSHSPDGPQVNVPSYQEVTAGDTLVVKCDVMPKSPPHMIQWIKEGDPYFRQMGDILRIERISVDEGGRYICQTASSLRPSRSNIQGELTGNGTVTVRIKYKPGQVKVFPVLPVAIAGRPFSLSCKVYPLGWPLPEYTWWKEGQENEDVTTQKSNYTLMSVHLSQEGRYFCQPSNSLGKGGIASVYLTVQEPASIIRHLRPLVIRKDKDRNFNITCGARGKPKPKVRWLQNGQEISKDNFLFDVSTTERIGDNKNFTVQSILYFVGPNRHKNDSLSPDDRGRYTCEFENGFSESARSDMILRIEHSPIVRHTYNRVAFDVGETAVLECKMQAYPPPQFDWFSRGRMFDEVSKYGTNVTDLGEDIYAGVLSIRGVKEDDYDEYTCRVSNKVGGDKKTFMKLVKKGPAERPTHLELIEVSSDKVTLRWQEGFDGGFANTEFLVTYLSTITGHQMNKSCGSKNLCQIRGLSANTDYHFKVLAVNPRGRSPYSEEMSATTKEPPTPTEVQYDWTNDNLTFNVEPSSLKLLAKIEAKPMGTEKWVLQTTIQVTRPVEEVQLNPTDKGFSDVRVRLCLESNEFWCGSAELANPQDG